jgi:hypothetical protein
MKFTIGIAVAALIASFARAAGPVTTDPLTKLPSPSAGDPIRLGSDVMQRWQSATLTEIQDTASRLVDTAALFQAMGTPPAPNAGP